MEDENFGFLGCCHSGAVWVGKACLSVPAAAQRSAAQGNTICMEDVSHQAFTL